MERVPCLSPPDLERCDQVGSLGSFDGSVEKRSWRAMIPQLALMWAASRCNVQMAVNAHV